MDLEVRSFRISPKSKDFCLYKREERDLANGDTERKALRRLS